HKILRSKKLIVDHSEAANILTGDYASFKVIKPQAIPFISYPYEWCFSQLKDAALLTLKIQKTALQHGMILKDASAYNIQFIGSTPIFIDTLSFERYIEGSPWIAYKQFCQHFLAPLVLMSYRSAELSGLLIKYIDGIPLTLASSLLPSKAILNSGISTHIFLHSKLQSRHSQHNKAKKTQAQLSKNRLFALIEHIKDCVEGLQLKTDKSNWVKYDNDNTYSPTATEQKEKAITGWLETCKPKTIWDMGCNTGRFSLLSSQKADLVIAMDSDHGCIESLYGNLRKGDTANILPLVQDLSNPSPAIGWNNAERKTISERGYPDIILALALIHHLRIGNNVPFSRIAEYFCALTSLLIIEFVPQEDIRVQQMLSGRENIFQDYTQENFIAAFEQFYTIQQSRPIHDSKRTLFLMSRKQK
ncbi:MAG TPA: SAM-dependent methyltransferase, partial [Bacteroidia bacterium]